MILADLVKVFSLTLCALTGMILLAGVVAEAMKSGLSPAQILAVIPLLAPSLMPYTLPTATLFATCVVYGRSAADNELLAVRAAGVHALRMFWPAAWLGSAASAATFLLCMDVIPYTNYLLRAQVAGDVEEALYGFLRRDGCIRNARIDFEIDVRDVRGRQLHDVIFKRRAADGSGYDIVARAREAELEVDLGQRRLLVHMLSCHLVQNNGEGVLEKYTWPIDLPGELLRGAAKQRASDMTWAELGWYADEFAAQSEELSQQIDAGEAALRRGKRGMPSAKHFENLINERKTLTDRLVSIDTETHARPALALGCICFALLGCPIGVWFGRSDYLSAFVTCFLPIIAVYYPLHLCAINLARSGAFAPWLSVYAADVLLLVVGSILAWRLARQ